MSEFEPGSDFPAAVPRGGVLRAQVSESPIAIADFEALVESEYCGAVVGFSGVVRDHDGGRGVTSLSYSAHPDADAVMTRLAQSVAADFPGVRLAIAHRVGALGIGDTALACAAASAHRAEAFDACRALVEIVKAELPVWKEQHFTDGSAEWVGL